MRHKKLRDTTDISAVPVIPVARRIDDGLSQGIKGILPAFLTCNLRGDNGRFHTDVPLNELHCGRYLIDNPVDGAVLDVLLRKAREIRHTLGISVPVPMESETVMEAVLKTLFFRAPTEEQLSLFDEPIVQNVHHRWNEAAAREQESRTRFAQRAITPEEVERELKETDAVLGDPGAVQRFVLNACQRLGVNVQKERNGQWTITNLTQLPDMVRTTVPDTNDLWRVTFTTPAPEGSTYLGRNHPFVSALAQYLLETSLTQGSHAPATRCGVMKTHTVERRVVLFLLRLRFLLTSPDGREGDGEETHLFPV